MVIVLVFVLMDGWSPLTSHVCAANANFNTNVVASAMSSRLFAIAASFPEGKDMVRLVGYLAVVGLFSAGATLEFLNCVRSRSRRRHTQLQRAKEIVVAASLTTPQQEDTETSQSPDPVDDFEIVQSQSSSLRNIPRNAEIVQCRTSQELRDAIRLQLPRWLQHGGAPAQIARSAANSAVLLLDLASTSPAHIEHGLCIVTCPYEVLPQVLASHRVSRKNLSDMSSSPGGTTGISVTSREDWPKFQKLFEQFCFDSSGGLLLRPSGTLYAVLDSAKSFGSWQSLSLDFCGLIVVSASIDSLEGALTVYHGKRVLRSPFLVQPEARGDVVGFPPSMASNFRNGRSSEARAYRSKPRELRFDGPPPVGRSVN